ncbi:MAG: S8 family serine peptidase, partial [Planctomycetota bacterium]
MRFILLVGLSAVLSAPSSAQEGAGNPRWSYLYGQQEVSLELDGARAAVLLADGARDEREALSALLADGPGFLPLAAGDAQGYPHLWFPRFVPGLSEDERLTAIDRLHGAPGVELASVVLRYRKALLVPRPELLVILEEGGSSTLEMLLAEEDLGWIGELPGLRPTYHLSADGPPTTVLERCRELLRVPGVAVAEPNFILHLEPLTVPSDPLFPDQWHLDNSGQSGGIPGADISAPAAWDITTGSSSVVIAVLDEGLDMSHPDLAPNIWGGHESTDQPSPGGLPGNADPLDGHGTSCAGIAAAIGNNGIGVSGVSWSAAILAVRIGYAAHWTEIAWEVDGITWAVDNGADVLSNSW